jgi:hypothetical protein
MGMLDYNEEGVEGWKLLHLLSNLAIILLILFEELVLFLVEESLELHDLSFTSDS